MPCWLTVRLPASVRVVIRTVRRFLERYGNKVDALVFVFANPGEQRSYDKVCTRHSHSHIAEHLLHDAFFAY
jgi:hypothetical protein